ncbi:RidA family protein [Arthrobacter sp. MSA 4-2]|uniref:RidA family protein n=1 Tax=Arthrobacter sp. MSA 4-2 TaxID=2794349 RepID=UPI0018E82F13|nr:RidA family protein [Arthrobacter sp. MSA 4-2]MBJ2121526.1 RidA family protein [Arthrobacter sp. MSA 4-2]
MSETTFLRSSMLYTGAQYAAAARVPTREHLIFTAGACPLNLDASTAAVGDYRGQAAKVMDNLLLALAAGGADFSHLAKTTVFVASSDREDLAEVWNVVRARMGDRDVPSTLLGVAVLGYPDQLVEVEAIAALPVPDTPAPAP